MTKYSKSDTWGDVPKPKYKRPPNQICANCGKVMPGSDLALVSQAISGHKPVCSYACNKALGQIH